MKMLFRTLILIAIVSCASCSSNEKPFPQKFDAAKWKSIDEKYFPYREVMLDSLVYSYVLKCKARNEVNQMLGEPLLPDKNYLSHL